MSTGSWGSGSCADNEILDISLAESGMVIIAVELQKAPTHAYPSQVIDVNYATRWAKAHAKEFNAIPDGIDGLGTSSGGHTLFLSAMRPDDARYSALNLSEEKSMDARLSYVIGAWPVIDPYARYALAKEKKFDFLVQATDAYFFNPDNMKEGSPLPALERKEALDLPPTLIIQGTGDANVPLDAVDRFAEGYQKAWGEIDLKWFENMPHNFAPKTGKETDRALEMMKDYISLRLTGCQKGM